MNRITYTVHTASLYIDGVHKEYRSMDRQAAADWLTDIMQRAGAVDLPITRPKITTETITMYAGELRTVSRLVCPKEPVYSSASSDPAILDWHPEWHE